MPCNRVTLAGVTAIVCTRGRRPRCACGQPATLQCDAPTKRRSGTCDRHLCASCATELGPEKHLCPAHSATVTPIDASGGAEPHQGKPAVAVQGVLF